MGTASSKLSGTRKGRDDGMTTNADDDDATISGPPVSSDSLPYDCCSWTHDIGAYATRSRQLENHSSPSRTSSLGVESRQGLNLPFLFPPPPSAPSLPRRRLGLRPPTIVTSLTWLTTTDTFLFIYGNKNTYVITIVIPSRKLEEWLE